MHIEKKIIAPLAFPYSLHGLRVDGALRRIVAGNEKKGRAIHFAPDGADVQTIWDGESLGGVTGLDQLPEGGMDFIAIEGAYKGFNCEKAGVIRARQENGEWRVTRLAELPFAHRMCVPAVGGKAGQAGKAFVLVASLCGGKDNKDDWSRPGAVWLAEWKGGDRLDFAPLIEGIHKNHGLFHGRFDGRESVLITGEEGVFVIRVPDVPGGEWLWERIMDEPVGDVCAYDIDADGEDELIVIRGFHGREAAVYKRVDGAWTAMYRFPVDFGHFIWGGKVLGRDAFITGYRGANAALVLFRKVPGVWNFDIDCIDQLESPINMLPLETDEGLALYVTNAASDSVARYLIKG